MLLVDGFGGDKWGGRGLAGSEAVVGAVGALILLAYFLTHRRKQPGAEIVAVES
jgi:Na+-driven multidrug efflux pump